MKVRIQQAPLMYIQLVGACVGDQLLRKHNLSLKKTTTISSNARALAKTVLNQFGVQDGNSMADETGTCAGGDDGNSMAERFLKVHTVVVSQLKYCLFLKLGKTPKGHGMRSLLV